MKILNSLIVAFLLLESYESVRRNSQIVESITLKLIDLVFNSLDAFEVSTSNLLSSLLKKRNKVSISKTKSDSGYLNLINFRPSPVPLVRLLD